jgi:transcriptional regulator with XRE-family HTH domain
MLGKKLKFLRKQIGYTQEYVANQLNINRVTYTNYERGEREPDCQMLKQIALFLMSL